MFTISARPEFSGIRLFRVRLDVDAHKMDPDKLLSG